MNRIEQNDKFESLGIRNGNQVQKIKGPGKLRLALYYIITVFIFFVWYHVTINVMSTGHVNIENTPDYYLMALGFSFVPLFLLFLINTCIVFIIDWNLRPNVKIFVDFLLSQLAPVIVNLLFIAISKLTGHVPKVYWMTTIIINFMIFMINEVMWSVQNYQRTQQLYEKANRIAVQLEYNVLRAQVNPHFLFNSLNILYTLIYLDASKAKKFVKSLSEIYRHIMTRRDSITVPIEDEMEFLNSYVDVLKILYYNCFELEMTGTENIDGQSIVPYSLQLLMENIIKHNVIDNKNPMLVQIEIDKSSLTVRNKITPKPEEAKPDSSTGIGLKYLTELYAMHKRSFKAENEDGYFVVVVPLLK